MGQSTKTQIVQVATALFCTQGYFGVTIRDIANKIGCSPTILYYHFKNKATLFHVVAYETYVQLNQQLALLLPPDQTNLLRYIDSIMLRTSLTGINRSTFELALKTIIAYNTALTTTNDLVDYHRLLIQSHDQLLHDWYPHKDPIYAKILSRVSQQIILSSLLNQETLTNQDLTKEIQLMLQHMERSSINHEHFE